MSDAVTLARTARESLAPGLNALQADPDVPPAPARARRTDRAGDGRAPPDRALRGRAARAERPDRARALADRAGRAPGAAAAAPRRRHGAGGRRGGAGERARPRSQPPSSGRGPGPALAGARSRPPSAQAAPRACRRSAAAAPARPRRSRPHTRTLTRRPPHAAPRSSPRRRRASRTAGAGGAGSIAHGAELGAHSPSNFYKGLSGNDIIDHGGLFVSTYKLPKIGATVRLKVSLPGGYEFEANAVVRWRREPSDAGDAAPPGFGAQFTEITPKRGSSCIATCATASRLFHDDL